MGTNLDNWGRILGVSRNIFLPAVTKLFGFGDSANPPAPPGQDGYPQAFNYGSFSSGGALFTTLPDTIFRCMLLLRYQMLISNMSILNIGDMLNTFFVNLVQQGLPGNTVNVQDNLNVMSITYTFETELLPYQRVIFNPNLKFSLLPRPLGVIPIILHG